MVASIIVEQLVLEKEPASQSNAHNEVAVTVIKHSLIVGPHLSENLFTDHIDGALLSAVQHLSYYWEKEERKRLGSTM